MPLTTLALIAAAAAPVFCAATPAHVAFTTKDGWALSALYRSAPRGGTVLVLVHGVGSSKGEWDRFAQNLADAGVGTLALDLRGHLDSRKGPSGPRGYQDFDASGEWPRAVEDLRAAASWLENHGVRASRIAFGGASIGANLASFAAAERPSAPFLLLLSPGPDYRGVRLAKPKTKTLVAASSVDGYAYQTLAPLASIPNVTTLTAPGGHGVQMFDDPATYARIIGWVVEASRRRRPL